MKTDVCITFDIEFTIGGAFARPEKYLPVGEQSVNCNINGKSHGLGFILNTLAKYKLPATFFVEALNFHYFGDYPMATFAKQILNAGHDVQLHIHPCWRYFKEQNWQTKIGTTHPNDSMARRSIDELHTFISEGLKAFQRWNIPKPVALRTGGLQVDKNVYEAMKMLGLALSSNIGVAIYTPTETDLHLYSGCHSIFGILELPVMSYCDLSLIDKRHMKSLTITGSSWYETKTLLHQAAEQQTGPVVILSHPSEFIKHTDVQYTDLCPNQLNQSRFIRLCEFLSENVRTFNVQTFSSGLKHWKSKDNSKNKILSIPAWMTIHRIIENKINDST